MFKKLLFALSLSGLLHQYAHAQQLLGIANSNYAGTNGVYMNPSSIADSRHGFYLNFFTFDGMVTNNYLRYNGPDLAQSLTDGYFGKDDQYLQEQLNGRSKMFTVVGDVRLPSFMLKLSPRHSIAFTSRYRTAIQGNNISEDILQAFRYGTGSKSLQNVFNNSQFSFNANSFLETGFTYGRVILDKDKHFVKGGLTIKRLYGVYSAHLINKELGYTIKEDADGNSLLQIQNLNTQMGFSRGQFDIDYEDALVNRNTPGKGWGFDLGFTYEYRPQIDEFRYTMDGKERLDNRKNKYKFRFGAALMDVGGIKYNDAGLTRKYHVLRQNVTITSEDLENTNADDVDDLLIDLLDIKPSEQTNSFRSGLPAALNVNLDYRIANRLYVNTTIVQGLRGKYAVGMRQNSMVSLTPRIEMKWLELAFPLSLMNNYGDFAFGTMLKLGPVFVGSDNIGGFINSGKPFGTNVYAGMALPIFKGKKKDKDKDGVSNRKDECKHVAGLWEFKGCPDSDGDGIQDSQDACPSLPGIASLKGCPDTDKDGIADSEDKCPGEAGLGKFGGCPDTDGDDIIDSEDSCPSTAGLAQFNGCPDTDGDSIPDKEDACPQVKGLAQFKGCPDKDSDGIADTEDRCPEQAGSLQAKGCPDTDMDGIADPDDECPSLAGSAQLKGCPDRDMDNVPDHKDNCPDTFGTIENKGCPLVKEAEPVKLIQLTTEEAKVVKEAFNNLEFETGKAIIKSNSLNSLEELAELLTIKADFRLLVSGHTDNLGNAATNVKLSKSRADAIKQYLVGKGVAPAKVITEGFGAKKPIASNTTEAGRQKNRRVELKIIK